jgi:thiol-disulfide isomerase/thioredoxin
VTTLQRALAVGVLIGGGMLAGFLAYRSIGRVPAARSASDERWHAHPSVGAAADAGADPRVGADAATPAGRPIPTELPDIRLPDLAGKVKSLRDFLGEPLIVNFWATWCAPCRREMPLLQQLRRTYRRDGLEIVGIAVDFRAAVADYARHGAVDYPLLIGEQQGQAAIEQFGMQPVLPFSIFADGRGRIVAVKIGELHREEADYILDTMRSVAAGRIDLPAARASIAERLRQLSVERAKAGAQPSGF